MQYHKDMMNFFKLIKITTKQWLDNDVSVFAASISYYTLFSIGPLITVLLWVLGLFFQKEAIDGQIFSLLREMVSDNAAKLIQSIVLQAGEHRSSGLWATLFGIFVTFYSASSIVVQMKDVLDRIWHIKRAEKKATLAKKYAMGIAGIFGIGIILLISGLMSGIVSVLSDNLFVILPFTKFIIRIANNLVVFISVAVFIATMFKYLPNLQIKWRAIVPGAIFTTAIFFFGKILFSWYMSTQLLDSTYGAASSVVVFIMWIYFSAQVIFYGAEFTQVYAMSKQAISK